MPPILLSLVIMSKLQEILQDLRSQRKVAIYVVDPDDGNPTALLAGFVANHPEFHDLLSPILCQPNNEFNGFVRIMCKYESQLSGLVRIKVVIPQSLDEVNNSDEIKYYKTISLEACESLFSLIEPLSKFILSKELISDKLSKDYY